MRSTQRRDRGMALFVTVLMLVFMAAIAFASLDTTTSDRQISGLQNRSRNAFYTAEAGVAEARSLVRDVAYRDQLVAFHDENNPRLLGDSDLYDRESRQPRYYGDPKETTPIQYLGESKGGRDGFSYAVNGQQLVNTLWQINVVGEAPGGSQVRLEAVELKVMSQFY